MGEFNISVGCVTFHSWLSLTESPPPLGSGSYWMILLITLHFFILWELWEISRCHHHPTQTETTSPKTTVRLINWINHVSAKKPPHQHQQKLQFVPPSQRYIVLEPCPHPHHCCFLLPTVCVCMYVKLCPCGRIWFKAQPGKMHAVYRTGGELVECWGGVMKRWGKGMVRGRRCATAAELWRS